MLSWQQNLLHIPEKEVATFTSVPKENITLYVGLKKKSKTYPSASG